MDQTGRLSLTQAPPCGALSEPGSHSLDLRLGLAQRPLRIDDRRGPHQAVVRRRPGPRGAARELRRRQCTGGAVANGIALGMGEENLTGSPGCFMEIPKPPYLQDLQGAI